MWIKRLNISVKPKLKLLADKLMSFKLYEDGIFTLENKARTKFSKPLLHTWFSLGTTVPSDVHKFLTKDLFGNALFRSHDKPFANEYEQLERGHFIY